MAGALKPLSGTSSPALSDLEAVIGKDCALVLCDIFMSHRHAFCIILILNNGCNTKSLAPQTPSSSAALYTPRAYIIYILCYSFYPILSPPDSQYHDIIYRNVCVVCSCVSRFKLACNPNALLHLNTDLYKPLFSAEDYTHIVCAIIVESLRSRAAKALYCYIYSTYTWPENDQRCSLTLPVALIYNIIVGFLVGAPCSRLLDIFSLYMARWSVAVLNVMIA